MTFLTKNMSPPKPPRPLKLDPIPPNLSPDKLKSFKQKQANIVYDAIQKFRSGQAREAKKLVKFKFYGTDIPQPQTLAQLRGVAVPEAKPKPVKVKKRNFLTWGNKLDSAITYLASEIPQPRRPALPIPTILVTPPTPTTAEPQGFGTLPQEQVLVFQDEVLPPAQISSIFGRRLFSWSVKGLIPGAFRHKKEALPVGGHLKRVMEAQAKKKEMEAKRALEWARKEKKETPRKNPYGFIDNGDESPDSADGMDTALTIFSGSVPKPRDPVEQQRVKEMRKQKREEKKERRHAKIAALKAEATVDAAKVLDPPKENKGNDEDKKGSKDKEKFKFSEHFRPKTAPPPKSASYPGTAGASRPALRPSTATSSKAPSPMTTSPKKAHPYGASKLDWKRAIGGSKTSLKLDPDQEALSKDDDANKKSVATHTDKSASIDANASTPTDKPTSAEESTQPPKRLTPFYPIELELPIPDFDGLANVVSGSPLLADPFYPDPVIPPIRPRRPRSVSLGNSYDIYRTSDDEVRESYVSTRSPSSHKVKKSPKAKKKHGHKSKSKKSPKPARQRPDAIHYSEPESSSEESEDERHWKQLAFVRAYDKGAKKIQGFFHRD